MVLWYFYRSYVALRKESVDRNLCPLLMFCPFRVALRKESVDRNLELSPWGAGGAVALRKESVDRNINNTEINKHDGCRSPQGERG